jgi:hypothetical protein
MAAEKVTIDQLKKGDVITFYYIYGHDVRPTVLVLNIFNNLVHGLNLNYLSAAQLTYIKTILGPRIYAMYSIENPKEFYDKELKPANLGIAYRTYKPERLSQLYRIGYKLETLEKDTGLKGKEEPIKKIKKEPSTITKPEIPSTLPEQIIPNTSTLPDNIFGVE